MTLVVRPPEDGDQGVLERVAAKAFDHDVDPKLADAFLRATRATISSEPSPMTVL